MAAQNSKYGSLGHITSLRPLRPENAPDEWEKIALNHLKQGEVEVAELALIGTATYLRFMRPLVMEESCRKCHTDEEDRVGEMRGGISVSIPWEPYRQALLQVTPFHGLSYAGLWLLGLTGIGFSRKRLREHLRKRRQDEERLRQSEEKYRLLAEGTAAIPWEFDLIADRWTYIAPQVATVLGYPPAEWTGFKFWADHIHEEDRERAVNYCRTSTEKGEAHDFAYRFLKKNGGIAWLRDVVSVELKNGRPHKLRGVMIDLSEHRLLEEKLRKMEAVGTLAAGVAHDFNNILTSLVSFATLVKRRHLEDAVSQDYLQEILDGVHRAAELTRGLLTFSRKQQIRMQAEDLNDIVARDQKMLRRVIRENIEIKTELLAGELPVMADRAHIEQVLLNLAINAQDAMPDGGLLQISTGRINLQDPTMPGPFALLTVADTGQGISKSNRERIFEPFFTTKEVGRGTGLGLAMAHGIIEQHGGMITVDSEPGRGSVFSIFLPLQISADQKPAAPEPEDTAASNQRRTILLVEDEDQVRRVLTKVLEANGYQVLGADNGEAGLALFRQYRDKISLAVMDMIMPGKNGREICEEMRREKPDLKALFLSGYPMDIVTGQEIADGRYHFMSKPVLPQELAAMIKQILTEQS